MNSINYSSIACLALLLFHPGLTSAQDIDDDTQADLSWLTVSSDPEKVKAARDKYERDTLGLIDSQLSSIADSPILMYEAEFIFKHDRTLSLEFLNSRLDESKHSMKSVTAAAVLCRMLQPSGRDYAINVLNSGSTADRLVLLGNCYWPPVLTDTEDGYQRFMLCDKAFVRALLKQLDDQDPKVVAKAINLCAHLKVPGLEQKFRSLLTHSESPNFDKLLGWLATHDPDQQILDIATKIAEQTAEKGQWSTETIQSIVQHAQEPIRTQAKNRLKKLLADYQTEFDAASYSEQVSTIAAITSACNKDDRDWLRDKLSGDPCSYTHHVLAAYIRLAPEAGKATALQWLENDNKVEPACQALAKVDALKTDEEVIEALIKGSATAESDALYCVCNVLIRIDRYSGQRVFKENSEWLHPNALLSIKSYLKNRSVGFVADAINKIKLIPEEEVKATVRKLKYNRQKSISLITFFYYANRSITQTDFGLEPWLWPKKVPIEFAEISGGQFNPEAVNATWTKRGFFDDTTPYTIQFIVDGRLYVADVQDHLQKTDQSRLIPLFNAILAISDAKGRFIELEGDRFGPDIVFADPTKFLPLVKQFDEPLSPRHESNIKTANRIEAHLRKQITNNNGP